MTPIKTWQEQLKDGDETFEGPAMEVEIEALRWHIRQFEDIVERLAFDIPAPNQHTPKFIMAVVTSRERVL